MQQKNPATALDVGELRRTLGSFATGVAVATTLDSEGIPRGFTARYFRIPRRGWIANFMTAWRLAII
jgi:flavin reductase (DIM6/NTAB) family NADH-FMN oxidoreductase RutF